MSQPKLLIPLDYLTEACFLSVNIDEKKFKMVLLLAQDQLKTLLGPEFYAQIETQYAAQSDTFTTANATLYEDYLKRYLAWQTYSFYNKFGQVDSTPTGIRQFKDENSDILGDIKMSAFENNVNKQAEYYKNEIINYLRLSQKNLSTAFPLWEDSCQEVMSWGISGVSAQSDAIFKVNKATITNE